MNDRYLILKVSAITFYLFLFYTYMYLIIFLGGPFFAFDHLNYINFIDYPTPFFYEPLYTIAVYSLKRLSNLNSEMIFGFIYVLFTLIPLLWIFIKNSKIQDRLSSLFIFAVILTKGFIIGFIAQRFFFSELALSALLITSQKRELNVPRILAVGSIHFSAISLLISSFILKRVRNLLVIIILMVLLYHVGVNLIDKVGWSFFNYDYSRYLELIAPSETAIMLPILQYATLLCLIILTVKKTKWHKLMYLCLFLGICRLLLSDIEVLSRVFQLQIDFILLMGFINANKNRILYACYAIGFSILQLAFSSKASEVRYVHEQAFQNMVSVLRN